MFALFAVVPVGMPVDVSSIPGFHDVPGSLQKIALQVASPDVGLLYLFAIASLAVYGTSLAGWASNNKLALLGGVRASSQMISYEVSLGLSLVGVHAGLPHPAARGDGGGPGTARSSAPSRRWASCSSRSAS